MSIDAFTCLFSPFALAVCRSRHVNIRAGSGGSGVWTFTCSSLGLVSLCPFARREDGMLMFVGSWWSMDTCIFQDVFDQLHAPWYQRLVCTSKSSIR